MKGIYEAYIDREIAAGYLSTKMSGRVLCLSVGVLCDGSVSEVHNYQAQGTVVGDTIALSKQQRVAWLSAPVIYKVY